ncbi:NADH-quinone oxidoreductase subunit J [Streptomyces sp. TRM75563]|uniref:NADH-quinone oxidoreductase subunit J n=1 Tax=Streptomyces sp. TRM75563 TaxID=2817418 RepID=UPI001F606AA5|nr:NADH-quinone oxidoreductase subunit J [Streptomyces sp. TRM75563]MCI4042426.1 NADH-quinone oxidoreductase subunit J [Streptomyces sp. TRM75563]
MLSDVAFYGLSVLAVAAGLLVFVFDSMARATFSLLTSLLCVAGVLIVLGLAYLGIVIVLMMTIEMAIMAVYMIMYMMNPAGLMPMTMVHNVKGAALICGALFALLTAGIFLAPWPAIKGRLPKDATMDLGLSLMGPQMLTMMTLGMALFATIVSSVVLATHRGRYDRLGDRFDARTADDPVRGGVGR